MAAMPANPTFVDLNQRRAGKRGYRRAREQRRSAMPIE